MLNIFLRRTGLQSRHTFCCLVQPFLYPHSCGHSTSTSEVEDIMELKTVVSRLNQFAPTSLAGSWDNVGLLVEPSPPLMISHLFLTNDLTEEVMEEALQRKANMILSYHPPIFVPLKRLTQSSWKERIVIKSLENRVAIFSPHTSYDAVKGGVNDWLLSPFKGRVTQIEGVTSPTFPTPGGFRLEATLPSDLEFETLQEVKNVCGITVTSIVKQMLGDREEEVVRMQLNCTERGLPQVLNLLQSKEGVAPTIEVTQLNKPPIPGQGPGRLVELEVQISLSEAVERVKTLLKLSHVRLAKAKGVTDPQEHQIRTVAVCAGSGASVLRGMDADLYITGEMSHHDVLDAVHRERSVILCDHSNTERGFLHKLKHTLAQLLDNKVEVTVSELDRDPLEVI